MGYPSRLVGDHRITGMKIKLEADTYILYSAEHDLTILVSRDICYFLDGNHIKPMFASYKEKGRSGCGALLSKKIAEGIRYKVADRSEITNERGLYDFIRESTEETNGSR